MTQPTATMTAQQKAGFLLLAAVADTIRQLGSVPSGHLYAQIMGKVDIHGFQKLVAILKGSGLVSESNDILTWIGPEIAR